MFYDKNCYGCGMKITIILFMKVKARSHKPVKTSQIQEKEKIWNIQEQMWQFLAEIMISVR